MAAGVPSEMGVLEGGGLQIGDVESGPSVAPREGMPAAEVQPEAAQPEAATPKAMPTSQTARRRSLSPSGPTRSTKMKLSEAAQTTDVKETVEGASKSTGTVAALGATLGEMRPFVEVTTDVPAPSEGVPAAEVQPEAAQPVKRRLDFPGSPPPYRRLHLRSPSTRQRAVARGRPEVAVSWYC